MCIIGVEFLEQAFARIPPGFGIDKNLLNFHACIHVHVHNVGCECIQCTCTCTTLCMHVVQCTSLEHVHWTGRLWLLHVIYVSGVFNSSGGEWCSSKEDRGVWHWLLYLSIIRHDFVCKCLLTESRRRVSATEQNPHGGTKKSRFVFVETSWLLL